MHSDYEYGLIIDYFKQEHFFHKIIFFSIFLTTEKNILLHQIVYNKIIQLYNLIKCIGISRSKI